MEKVTAKMFFSVLWRGLCQALGWFFGLFGYKRNGRYAKCVWRVFATSAAVISLICAVALVYVVGKEMLYQYNKRYGICEDQYCYENTPVWRNIYYHDHTDGKGYIYNIFTGEKFIKHVAWIAQPTGKDSLVCFSDGKKRGYFNKYTGKVAIKPTYDHAWIFSDGLASVEEDAYIKFIDTTGKVVIDNKIPYQVNMDGYVFHGGYCVIEAEDDDVYGLMDKTGKMVLPQEYSSIKPSDDFKYWCAIKGNETVVLDKELKPVFKMTDCNIFLNDGFINVTMPDHTIRKYDMQGNLINDFYIAGIDILEYEKDEILYRCEYTTGCNIDDEEEKQITSVEPYHPRATARLRSYYAGDGYEGLITAEGHVVTMPLYQEIEALGYDLYLCTSSNYDKVIVNGKGETVR